MGLASAAKSGRTKPRPLGKSPLKVLFGDRWVRRVNGGPLELPAHLESLAGWVQSATQDRMASVGRREGKVKKAPEVQEESRGCRAHLAWTQRTQHQLIASGIRGTFGRSAPELAVEEVSGANDP